MRLFKLCQVVVLGAIGMTNSCSVDPGTVLQIVNAPVPELGTCSFRADLTQFRSSGVFDVSFGSTFTLGLRIRSGLAPRDEDPTEGFQANRNNAVQARAINVSGFDVCWFLPENLTAASLANFNCNSLPDDQRAFVPSSATIAEDTEEVVSFQVLTPEQLQSDGMFGSAFSGTDIPEEGIIAFDTNRDEDTSDSADFVYSPSSEDATSPGRSTFWGTWPSSPTTEVIIRARARGTIQTGREVTSQWFNFPVELCARCILDFCGPLAPVICDDTCAVGGTACPAPGECVFGGQSTPFCSDTTAPCTCVPDFDYSGDLPVFGGCLPAQFFGEPACNALPTPCTT